LYSHQKIIIEGRTFYYKDHIHRSSLTLNNHILFCTKGDRDSITPRKTKRQIKTPNKPPSHSIYQYATEVYSVIPIKIKTIFKKKEKTESGFLFPCKTKVRLQHQKIPIPFFKFQRKSTRFKRSQTT